MILTDYSIKVRTAVFVLMAIGAIGGGVCYRDMPREGAPDITIPFVFVTAMYEGTAPGEMEKLVTVPIEKSLNTIEDIKEIRSSTSEGRCMLSIEFIAGEDIDQARQRVKDKVDLARSDLPDDLDEPIVSAFNFSSDFPILTFALSGGNGADDLRNLAEQLKSDIEALAGVKEAAVSGTREREIRVEWDPARLAALDIAVDLIIGRIAGENRTLSAGNLDLSGHKFQVRVPGEFALAQELGGILLTTRDGSPVYLRDVASVADTYKDLESISRINGQPCVSVGVKKRSGENAVRLADQVRGLLEAFRLPPGVTTTVVMDQSEYVRSMVEELENSIASGLILVVLVVFAFMGFRNSVFVALAIPMSMLLSFVTMSLMGFTLNMIVLFSLVLGVGMLVDNSIVIVENTYRLRCAGLSRAEAARRGAAEVAWPVTTSTLTTVAAFAPLLFWPGIMGQFMAFLPKTLIITLTASLFVGLVINPAVCSLFIKANPRRERHAAQSTHPFMRGFETLLRGALARRGAVMLTALAVMILTIQAYARWGKGVELFPETEPRNATISVRFAQGAGIAQTDIAMRRIEELLKPYEDIEFTLTTVGGGSGLQMGDAGSAQGTHIGQIHIEFLDKDKRKGNSGELVAAIRKAIGQIPGAEVTVDKEREGPPTGAPVSIEIAGEDFETLSDLARRVTRAIESVAGLVDLRDDFEEALPEMAVKVDRDRAALYGLDTGTVGAFLRTAIYGTETSRFRSGDEEYDITLRLPAAQRDTMGVLERLMIPVPAGSSVPLSSVCSVTYRGGKGTITRKDQKRVITVTGSNDKRGVDKILADVRPRVARIDLPRGYTVAYAGDNQEMIESGAFLRKAFGVALGLILIILVLQFNSIGLPAVIGASVLMSIVGVLWGLLACNLRFGVVMTGLGVISLAGVVVNNAIVLVDCALGLRAGGLSALESVVAASKLRLRPVLLTAGTTVLGLIPMAVGLGLEVHHWPPRIVAGAESSAWWAPMAVAVIFGLTCATVLTLVLVPCMYVMVDSAAAWLRRRFGFGIDD
jgi:multidrug efflux pump subunit AcrB